MTAEREMTLHEWVGKLPEIHRANREFLALQARITELEAALSQSMGDHVDTGRALRLARAENQRLRDALESIDESTHDVHAARKARKALLGGGENGHR